MIIYIDENFSPYLADGFNILQTPENRKHNLSDPIEVRSIKNVFGEGVEDEEWIPKAGEEGACIITQDYNIQRINHQRKLCEAYNLGMFYFRPPSKVGFSYWDMVFYLVKHWPEIIEKASRVSRPFSYKITARSNRLESLD